VYGGPDFQLNPNEVESLFLPDALRADIEHQVHSFFAHATAYKRLQIRLRRGLLFVGGPGNGKTLLLRHLVRQCHQRYRTTIHLLNAGKNTADYELAMLFHEARRTAPSLVLVEDFDSLLTESRLSRATVLAQLDGLESQNGILFIATTNHPESIDSAFVHRPSRFDRVWHFPLPDLELRHRYLAWALTGVAEDVVADMADQTEGWSFACLSELRTTAAILSLDRPNPAITGEDVTHAFALLAPQFQNGRKQHVLADVGTTTGFRPE
jgi:SpoVK/Ycf46/Vps4 family AAA+-type ATPase